MREQGSDIRREALQHRYRNRTSTPRKTGMDDRTYRLGKTNRSLPADTEYLRKGVRMDNWCHPPAVD